MALKHSEPADEGVGGHDPAAAAFLFPNPRAALALPLPLRLIINLVCRSADGIGFWRFPRHTEGCFETMTLTDKLYWFYKSARPVRRAEKGSSLEAYFLERSRASVSLPQGFSKQAEVKIAAVGDLMENDLLIHSSPFLYEDITEDLFSSDLSFANLEVPLTGGAAGKLTVTKDETPSLHLPDEQFAVLKGHRERTFTVLSTASNHTWDYGEEGVLTTLRRLAAEGIAAVGTNRNPEDQNKATILTVNGLKIGWIAMTFGLNGKSIQPHQAFRVNRVGLNSLSAAIDLDLPKRQLRYCREHGCDFIVGSLHWGREYEYFPTTRQIETAHELAEAGLDMIIGHHPHIVQPVEFYRPQRDPDRTVVIAYSLGNLVCPCSDTHLATSFLLKVTLARGILHGRERTDIESCQVIPICQQAFMHSGQPALRLVKVSDPARLNLPFPLSGR